MKRTGPNPVRENPNKGSPVVPSSSTRAAVEKEFSEPIVFAYDDQNRIECELSEFFSYAEVTEEAPGRSAFRRIFQQVCGDENWLHVPLNMKKDFVSVCLDGFEHSQFERRVQYIYALSYVSEGLRNDVPTHFQRLHFAKETNTILKESGALMTFIQALALYPSSQTEADDICRPSHPVLRAILNLLYFLVQFNKSDAEFCDELSRAFAGRKTLTILLFGYISDFNEKVGKYYPIKKILLLLWKVMCATLGTLKSLKEQKNEVYKRAGFPSPEENPFFAKTKTFHISQFREEISKQYSTNDPDNIPDAPNPVEERQKILKLHQLPSYWELKNKELSETLGYDDEQGKSIPRILIPDPSPVEELYRALLPNLSRYVIILLKILLAASPTIKNYEGAIVLDGEMQPKDFEPHEKDLVRHKEIIVQSISAILLLLLKHFRSNHIMQFYHLGTLLSDSNCILLILKYLNQEIPTYCLTDNDDSTYAMYDQFTNGERLCSWRNTFSSINLLRILQKLTKNHPTRIRVLLQYKGPIILRRAYRANEETLQYYVLKLVKAQTKYLGRKWRLANMKLVSAIYERVRMEIRDEWLMGDANAEAQSTEAEKNDDKELREEVNFFNKRNYSEWFSSPADDRLTYEDIFLGYHTLGVMFERISVDEKEFGDYEAWVDAEVSNSLSSIEQYIM